MRNFKAVFKNDKNLLKCLVTSTLMFLHRKELIYFQTGEESFLKIVTVIVKIHPKNKSQKNGRTFIIMIFVEMKIQSLKII